MSNDLKKPNSASAAPLRIPLKSISRSQSGVRHRPQELESLRTFLKANQNRFPSPVAVNRFEDGTLYLRDGHGRVSVAEELGVVELVEGRDFVLESYTYAQFANTDLKEGWVTPFDPRLHLRLAELGGYKRLIAGFAQDQVSDAKLMAFIDAHPEAYRVNRTETGFVPQKITPLDAAGLTAPVSQRLVVDGPDCVAKAVALAARYPDVVIVGDCSDLLTVRQAQVSAPGANLVFLHQANRSWPLA